jgi:hypothetical protein
MEVIHLMNQSSFTKIMNIRSCDLDRYVRCINGKGNAMHGYLITDSNTLDLVSKALIYICTIK